MDGFIIDRESEKENRSVRDSVRWLADEATPASDEDFMEIMQQVARCIGKVFGLSLADLGVPGNCVEGSLMEEPKHEQKAS